jgi:hypothetical protein
MTGTEIAAMVIGWSIMAVVLFGLVLPGLRDLVRWWLKEWHR